MLFTQVILNTVLKICSLPKAFYCFVLQSRPEHNFSSNLYRKANRQRGMTFIEVLVALFILTTGIIGAVAMQASVKKGSFDAMQRSVASALAQDIIERIRVNDSNNTTIELYEGTFGDGGESVPSNRCNDDALPCTPAQMATNDLYEWEQKLLGADVVLGEKNAGGLIGARGCISHTLNNVTVIVSWQGRIGLNDGADTSDSMSNNCGTSGDKRRQIEISGYIY